MNDDYESVFVFDNDHPCVDRAAPLELAAPPGIYENRPARGVARVICYTPRHDLSLAELGKAGILRLMRVWQAQYLELGAHPEVQHVLVFENRGEVVGVSNPHPHCQVYATNFIFKTTEIEVDAELEHLAEVLEALLVRYDNLWRMPFPYVMALHQAPVDGGDYRAHHFHIQLHPPLRKPNLLKYLAGPEVGAGGFISDTAPEEKARELLAVPLTHYKHSSPGGRS